MNDFLLIFKIQILYRVINQYRCKSVLYRSHVVTSRKTVTNYQLDIPELYVLVFVISSSSDYFIISHK